MSSNGSGTNDPRIVLAGTAPQPLSSAQRDAQRAAMAQQLEAVTLALNQQGRAILALRQELLAALARVEATEALASAQTQRLDRIESHIKRHEPIALGRLDALERVTAARWALPLWSRLRWLVVGR